MGTDQPTPGHPVARGGKPYIWTTWLSSLLGGRQCVWSAWFKAHFKYTKFEEQASQLAEWNRDHGRLMREIKADLEENGWRVKVESENDFKLEGALAVLAGKPDVIATMPGHVLVVDGKTGRPRDSDWWQVLIYLYALQFARKDLVGTQVAEVHYLKGDRVMRVLPAELTDARRDDIIRMVKAIAAHAPPAKAPSRDECMRCNIGFADCPERFRERDATAMVEAF